MVLERIPHFQTIRGGSNVLRRFLACLLLLLTAFVTACSGEDLSHGQPLGPQGNLPASIEVRHVLERSVPASIDSFRFTGVDINGQIVFGPETRPRASTILLTPVPLACVGFQIEYLTNGVVVGIFRTEVQLRSGETYIIDGPGWVDVGDFGPPAKLGFVGFPAGGAPNQTLNPAVLVAVLDANNNLVANSSAPITLALASGPGTLAGTLTIDAVNGVATFSDLTLSADGTYVLRATSPLLTSADSNPLTIQSAPAAAGLAFSIQPVTTLVNATQTVEVRVLDQFGNFFAGFNGQVSLALGNNPSGATLTGTTVATAVNGVATFNNLNVNRVGTGYTLIASATGLTPATSNAFNITAAPGIDMHRPLVVPVGPPVANTISLATADFNADGLLDAATVSSTEGEIYVLLQTARGDFTVSEVDAPGGQHVVAGDFNGDGLSDLAVARNLDLAMFLGNGIGGFTAAGVSPLVLDRANDLAAGDVNGDGLTDVVVTGISGVNGRLEAWLSNGNAFTAGPAQNLTAEGFGVELGNLLGTASLDLAVAVNDGSTRVMSGDGTGAFTTSVSLITAGFNGRPRSVALGNVDGVIGLDVVVGSQFGALDVFLNNAGAFPADPDGPYFGFFGGGENTNAIACGDLNGDGRADVVAADFFNGQANVALSSATAPLLQLLSTTELLTNPTALTLADLNGDGLLDLGATSQADLFARLDGTGDGNLEPLADIGSDTLTGDTGDVNGDGLADAVIVDSKGLLNVYLGITRPLPTVPSMFVALAQPPTACKLADMDGDGDLDLAGVDIFNDFVLIYLNDGAGNFSAVADFAQVVNDGARIDVGDMNGDSLPDMAVCGANDQPLVQLFLSTGGLTYTQTDLGVTEPCHDLRLGDLDGDGDLDLALAQTNVDLGLFLNNGAGVFTAGPTIEITDLTVTTVGIGDLNGDGVLDLIGGSTALGNQNGAVSVVLGLGGATYATPIPLASPDMRAAWQVLVTDLNQDGLADVVVTDQQTYGAAIYTNNGDGTSYTVSDCQLHMGGQIQQGHRTVLIVQSEPLFLRQLPENEG